MSGSHNLSGREFQVFVPLFVFGMPSGCHAVTGSFWATLYIWYAVCSSSMAVADTDVDVQELDCIVNHMMTVAEYLDWDVSELKPVNTDFIRFGLDCMNSVSECHTR